MLGMFLTKHTMKWITADCFYMKLLQNSNKLLEKGKLNVLLGKKFLEKNAPSFKHIFRDFVCLIRKKNSHLKLFKVYKYLLIVLDCVTKLYWVLGIQKWIKRTSIHPLGAQVNRWWHIDTYSQSRIMRVAMEISIISTRSQGAGDGWAGFWRLKGFQGCCREVVGQRHYQLRICVKEQKQETNWYI